jgi:DNA (cytosine-5)-methyltransferase 1
LASDFRVAGLFAGIAGIEQGFTQTLGSRVVTELLCESWEPAQRVLRSHYPDVPLFPDVRTLRDLPDDLDVLAAGFPCTDLSQAGRQAGIVGPDSGLVVHLFEMLRLAQTRSRDITWLFIENVSNMLLLDKGKAMAFLVDELDSLGFRWAYRVVDSRSAGVPQRRRRVILIASRTEDPRGVLFADETEGLNESQLRNDSFGFYWTEGRTGLGWAQDAIPTLKGGSAVGIPSPPAVWLPDNEIGSRFVTPSISDAEALQGFPRGWTESADIGRRNGPRWKLVGNAVTVGVAAWVASRLDNPGDYCAIDGLWSPGKPWPTAAWGENGKVRAVSISEFPKLATYTHLTHLLTISDAKPLSHRAASGFWSRLQTSKLGRHPGFRDDIARYVEATES